jgi:flagellar hook-associated protein 2
MITTSGVGSGLDIKSLVTQLVAAERAGSDLQLTRETNKVNTKLSALGSLKGALSNFQATVSALNLEQNVGKRSVTSSDSAALSATASNAAVANTYSLNVTQLAESHSLASMSFAATDTAVGTGTLTFRFGKTTYNANTDSYTGFALNADSKVSTITIDSSNNTLAGVMKAINDADIGINASIVNAGDGFKLLLAGENTGLINSMEISTVDGDGNHTNTGASAGLSNFVFSAAATNMNQVAEAKDANFSINGLPISNASNTVKNAVSGIDLTLKKTTTGPVSLTVKKDNASALAAVQSFVSGYNNLAKTVRGMTSYDAAKNLGGPLLGDFSVRTIKSKMDSVLRNAIEGLTGTYTSLAEVGIKTTSDGSYSLDTAKFTAALEAAPDSINALFSAYGKPTDTNISYKTSSDVTAVGNYDINVSALASSGTFTGNGVLPAFTPGNYLTLDANNSSLNIELDGVETGNINLTTGEYQTGAALASEIQARINGASTVVNANLSAKVSYDASNNRFLIESNSMGSLSTVKIKAVGTNVGSSLGFTVADGVAGQNVAGTLGGVAATGQGQVLKGAAASPVDGLELTVKGGAIGARGSVNFTRGVANQLALFLKEVVAEEGNLESRIESLKERQTSVEDKRARQEIRWTAVQQRYLAKFNALDSLVASLNSTSNFLTTQLASLPGVVQK